MIFGVGFLTFGEMLADEEEVEEITTTAGSTFFRDKGLLAVFASVEDLVEPLTAGFFSLTTFFRSTNTFAVLFWAVLLAVGAVGGADDDEEEEEEAATLGFSAAAADEEDDEENADEEEVEFIVLGCTLLFLLVCPSAAESFIRPFVIFSRGLAEGTFISSAAEGLFF